MDISHPKTNLLTIALPVVNGGRTIRAAITSLINQTITDWILYIMDDGSSDNTKEVVSSLHDSRICLLSDKKNLGVSYRLNQVIEFCNSPYFARMDADDISYPDRFEKQLQFLQENPELDLVGSWILVFDQLISPIGKVRYPVNHKEICNKPYSRIKLAHPTFFGKTNWFKEFNYDQNNLYAQDQDILLRSFKKSTFANVPEILHGYRVSKPKLKKLLSYRQHQLLAIYKHMKSESKLIIFPGLVIEQVFKISIDGIFALIYPKFNNLRYRSEIITPEENFHWLGVLKTNDFINGHNS